MRDTLAWVLAVEALGLAALPLLRLFFANRRDAALLSRPLGLAFVAYVAWAATLLPRIPFDRKLLLIVLAALGVVAWYSDRRRRPRGERFWGSDEWRAARWFWIPAGIFLIIRAAVPEILGAEKFMDLAFFNSIARHGAMPPLDPWMSGKTINYYYWGYLLAAVLAKIASVTPFVSYNLCVGTFAGYSFSAAACLGERLSGGRPVAALGAGFAAVFAGNVQGAIDAIRAPFERGFDYWHASRVIANGDTINEFPFFTFFHADLHPHLLAFPYFLAAFACAHRLLEQGPFPEGAARPPAWRRALPYALTALVAGTAIAANTWNLPAVALGLALATALRGGRPARPGSVIARAAPGALTAAAALLLFRPYTRTYALPYNGLGWTTQRSGLFEFLRVWGLFFAVAAAALWPAPGTDEASRRRRQLRLAGAAGIGLLATFVTGRPALLLLVFLSLLALGRARSDGASTDAASAGRLYTDLLALLAFAIVAGCEFIYFKDSYGDQLQRMNTIFKFYLQAWPLLGVAAAVLAERASRAGGVAARVTGVIAVLALGVALLYPINATVSRLRQREGAFTLDALPALARRNPGDAAAILWLEQHAPARAVILEATGDPYREFARISSHTGLPTVLGWANHEGLWRGNDPEVGVRAQLVRGFYSTADEVTASEIVKKYGVQYVVLGDLERTNHPNAEHVARFLFLQPVSSGATTVYKVNLGP